MTVALNHVTLSGNLAAACEACLRRSALLASLAPRIARRKPSRRELLGLLALPDEHLIAAVGADPQIATGGARGPTRTRSAAGDLPRNRDGPSVEPSSAQTIAICRHDPGYPSTLRELQCPPAALHIAGALRERFSDLLDGPVVAVLGSRRCTWHGRDTAFTLARELAEAGVTVLGGLAQGIESAAHHGALHAGGATIAVMPAGANVPYPIQHDHLHATVLARGIALSELPPNFGPPHPWCFLARNRIIAALADLVVIVEAGIRSGTMFTAEQALELGREVAVVPGRPADTSASGSNALLRDGAHVILDAKDALALLGARYNHTSSLKPTGIESSMLSASVAGLAGAG
jgi:DNA processing protein